MRFSTLAAHGVKPDNAGDTSVSPPLYQSSVYTLRDLRSGDAVLTGAEPGFSYGRDRNPTVEALAAQVARLESAETGQIVSSGNGALLAALLTLLPGGGLIAVAREIYGGSLAISRGLLKSLGFRTRLVDTHDDSDVAAALAEGAEVLLLETLSNPLGRVCDLERLAAMAHTAGAKVIVDNTFATPFHAQPHTLGADLVLHSLTKFIGGHSDLILGAVTGADTLLRRVHAVATVAGLTPDPFAAWLADRGARTLALRMERSSSNALKLARALEEIAAVDRVYYPGLPSHPDHELAARVLHAGYGAIVSMRLKGGFDAVQTLIRRLKLCPFAPSLGDVTTTPSHPVIASHRELSPEEKAFVGIDEGVVRISVGIEDATDIIEDFQAALS